LGFIWDLELGIWLLHPSGGKIGETFIDEQGKQAAEI